jgi:glycosyltransferase involved in cell wall biosynthesis
MRVLHISSGNLYGGVETLLATLAREADAAPGMDPSFALCFDGRCRAELEGLGASVHMLGGLRLSRPHTALRARRALSRWLASEAFDVVVCHQPWTCVAFAPVAQAAGVPVVLWLHMASRGGHWLERLCTFTHPDLVICNSRFTAACASEWLHEPIEHVYCPVSATSPLMEGSGRAELRRSLQTPPGDVVVVQVGRLEAFKGQQVLVQAISSLRDHPGWTCWIVGGAQRPSETGYLRDLQAFVHARGIGDRVRFTGERTDVHAVMSAADIYCQPNTEPEGFGLTFIEAMQAGLPVVTSGIGAACELVNGRCGMLVPPGEVPALADALRRLIVDADLRARLGAEARRRPDELCSVPRQMARIKATLSAVAPSRVAVHAARVRTR